MIGRRFAALLALAVVCLFGGPASNAGRPVDLALVLAVDCSYSVSADEFRKQAVGLSLALRHPHVIAAIQGGQNGAISVAVVQWSSSGAQIAAVPWTLVDGPAAALALADRVAATQRLTREGGTSISHALEFSAALFASNPFTTERRVIDVSGDGRNNNGVKLRPVRDRIVADGITINGLVILNEDPTLDRYFESDVVGGVGSFVVRAEDYDDYVEAMRRKLLREINNLVS